MAEQNVPHRYKLVFFTPPSYLSDIKEAIFTTGAGSYDKYINVCFTCPGTGQFMPTAEAKPAIGQPGKLEELEEVRCEVICNGTEQAKQAVAALKSTHPYEVVAYEVYRVENM